MLTKENSMNGFIKVLSVSYITAIVTQLGGCAGSAAFEPSGGIVIPSQDVGQPVSNKLKIFSETGVISELSVYCYRPKDSQPWIARAGFYLKELLFSRDDNKSCQFIGVSQLEVTQEFSNAAAKLMQNQGTNLPSITTLPAVDASPTAPPVQLSPTAKLRNSYAEALFNIEEYNCRSFLASTFSTRALADTQKDFMSTLGTGVSTGTAIASPHFSAALGVANLVYGSGIDSVSKNIYLDKTTEALATAIQSSRIANRQTILIKKLNSKYEEYPIESLLSDVKAYESLCSVSSGAVELNRVATQKLGETATNSSAGDQQKAIEGKITALTEAIKKIPIKAEDKQSLIDQAKALSETALPKANIGEQPSVSDAPLQIIDSNKLPTSESNPK